MRRHDEIGYDAFNSYRSGDENSRRNSYGSLHGNERGGSSVYGRSSRDTDSADRNFSTEPGYGYSNRQPSNNPQGNYNPNRYNQTRGQESNYGNRNQGMQGNQGNRSWQGHSDNWVDRAEERMENWGNKINDAWNNWHGDDNNRVRQNWVNHPEHYPTYSHGNAMGNRYSENYDNSGYRRQENRGGNYENRGGRHEDEGFFDHLGHRISNAWDRWVGNDVEEERQYQNRSRYGQSDRNSSYEREDRW